jgi:hypothetical protein
VTVTVDAVIYFKIFDPVLSVNRVADAQFSTRLLAATTLRNILGTKTLQGFFFNCIFLKSCETNKFFNFFIQIKRLLFRDFARQRITFSEYATYIRRGNR